MGDLIALSQPRAQAARARAVARPIFFFDLASPFSYLTAERVQRLLGDAEWVPAAGLLLDSRGAAGDVSAIRAHAERRARVWRLPLVWPDSFPAPVPRAMRAAAYAAEAGAAERFALATSRLAFCGGFDVEDPEMLAEAAAAASISLDAVLEAAADPGRERAVHAAARRLRRQGARQVPAIRVGRILFDGEDPVAEALALLHSQASAPPVVPSA